MSSNDIHTSRSLRAAVLATAIWCMTVLAGLPVARGQPAEGVANEIDAACEKVIKQTTPLIDAAGEFKVRRGLWPAKLADLVPEFLSNLPASGIEYRWDPEGTSTLWLAVGVDSSNGRGKHVVYVFDGLDQGWYCGFEGRLQPRYKIDPLRSPLPSPSDADIDHALSETARRIEANPKDQIHHKFRVSLLYKAGRFQPARAAALVWIRAFPRDFTPRYALMDIERKLLAGLDRFESSIEWERKNHASFGRWRLFNSPNTNTGAAGRLSAAAELPFASSDAEWLIAEMAAYEGAYHKLERHRYREAIQICDLWQAAAEKRFESCDASYFAIRAAGYLKLGEFDKAEADIERIQTRLENGLVWADGIEALRSAVRRRDSEFEYRHTRRVSAGYDWLIQPR